MPPFALYLYAGDCAGISEDRLLISAAEYVKSKPTY